MAVPLRSRTIYVPTDQPACLATLPQPTLKLHRWQRGEAGERQKNGKKSSKISLWRLVQWSQALMQMPSGRSR